MALLTPPRLRLLIAAVVCLRATIVLAQPAAPIEANVKAVFLFNFTKYVTWPASGIGERSPSYVRICVTANDEFFSLLKAAVEGEAVDGRPLVAVALDGLDDAKTCQILYIGDSKTPDAKAWLSVVRGVQVLTVGDGELNDETVIAFVRDDNRIRFDINRAAANRRNLNVSAKLLRLARKVRDR
jgi:YfiR/HmsC-like